MVDETRQVVTEYKVKIDKATYDRLTRQLQQIQQKQVRDAKKSANLNSDIRKALLKQVEAKKAARKEDEKALKVEKDRLAILEKQNSAVRNQVGGLGDVDTAFQTVGSVAGAPGLQAAGDVFAVAEAFGQLRGVLPLVTEQAKTFAQSLSPKGLGVAAIAAVATVAVFAAAKAISDRLVPALADVKRQTEAAIEAEKERADTIASGLTESELQEKILELTRTIETEANKLDIANNKLAEFAQSNIGEKLGDIFSGSLQSAKDELEAQKTVVADLVALRNEYTDALLTGQVAENTSSQTTLDRADNLRKQFEIEKRVTAFIDTATGESLQKRLDALNQEIELIEQQKAVLADLAAQNTELGTEAKEDVKGFNEQLEALRFELGLLTGTAQETVELRDQEKNALEQSAEAEKRYTEQQRERERVLGRLTNLEQAAASALENFTNKQAQTLEDRQIRDLRELEDWQAQRAREAEEHQRELADIQADGNERVRDIQSQLGDLSSDFYTEEQDAVRQYQKDLRKLNQQYYMEDKQALDDHLADLRNAEQNNDVLAFIQAQQNFQKEKRERETNRSQDFKELNDQYQEERRLRQRNFNDRRAELQRELQLAREQTRQRISEAQQAFRREQQLASEERQRRLQRQREDDQIADARERDALRRSLQAIEAKANAEIQGANAVIRASSGIVAIANRIASAVRNAGGSSGSSSGSGTRFSGSTALGEKSYERAQRERRAQRAAEARRVGDIRELNRLGAAYAEGGIVSRPTMGLLGERRPEMILPLRKGNLRKDLEDFGFNTRGNSGRGINVSIAFSPNMNIGELVSPSEVTNALQQFANELQQQVETGINRSVNLTA